MATDKKHIAVYLEKENEAALNEYVVERGGIKFSAAINEILAAYFGHTTSRVPSVIPFNPPVTPPAPETLEEMVKAQVAIALGGIAPSELLEKMAALEAKVEALSATPSTAPENLEAVVSDRIEAIIQKQMTEALGELAA